MNAVTNDPAAPLRRSLAWAEWWPSVRAGLWVVALFALALVLVGLFAMPLQRALAEHAALGAAVFLASAAVAVLLPAATNLPLVPLAVLTFGTWPTAALLLAGWTIGSALSFALGRFARAAVLRRLPAVQRHAGIDRLIVPRHRLASLVMLRMTFPVDVLSYALGLFSPSTTLVENTLATAIGAAPFALLFAWVPALEPAAQLAVFGASTLAFAAYVGWVLRRGGGEDRLTPS